MSQVHVLIADDHPLFRKGLRTMLESMSEINVVGEAATGDEAVEQAADLQPDLVLMDLQMPGGGGIAATREIRHASPNIRVLVITLHEDDDSVFAALRAGASGYVLKDTHEEDIKRALLAVAAGQAIFSPAVAARVLKFFESPIAYVPKDVLPELTDRERTILHLMAQGKNNQEIARELNLRLKTVANYSSNIFAKLQVADRVQAILLARDAGLGQGG
ncbi:response regulator [Ornithinibacillus californiensis]|uniref:response regulator n=1 Tax=Ornithinibacillus californiensis TaxID=161536 RepID=UPI000A0765A3|nr:response regulator transcription factor [Ornithinibacillus californiensis]